MADTSLLEKNLGLLIWQVSNYWQSKLRKILKNYNLTLNEYLVLQTINDLSIINKDFSQKMISNFSSIDNSVVSVTLKLLESKNLISRINKTDNRKKNIEILDIGNNLFNKIYPKIMEEEKIIFDKLQSENYNFINSLKLILGKSIRIKAKKNNETN
tara:strand:+ start:541 stop:1011 length:471 start_codon:yes stop_codon:yes gene_type:complete